MKASLLKGFILAIACICALSSTVEAQPTATDLSYYPLHPGNVWLYKVYKRTFQGDEPWGWREDRIVADTLLPNGKRYFAFNSGRFIRMDSTTGQAFMYNEYERSKCLDTNEFEIVNVTVQADTMYRRCADGLDWGPWEVQSMPPDVIGELSVDIKRPRRLWRDGFMGDDLYYAEGIGLYYMAGGYFIDKLYYLYYAKINGVEYWPVTFRSFTATALPDGAVHLRWHTENEIQNAGFTVQRRIDNDFDDWTDLAFVPARAGEGRGASYEYTDYPAASQLRYRLRQLDFDGSVAYSDIVNVYADIPPSSSALTLWPNPTSTSVSIHTGIDSGNPASLLVTDMLGRIVRRFDTASPEAVMTWDLRDASGNRVVPGMYCMTVLQAGRRISSMVVVQ